MEVCVDNIQSVINAVKGGAVRLELCSALSEGGLTPTIGFLNVAKTMTTIPIFVMIRPRTGNDFTYSVHEIEIMKHDMKLLKENGADGFVFGALTSDKNVDIELCEQFLKIADPLPSTFHRAFDYTRKPFEALEDIIRLGFKRILTNGQESTAEKGTHLIKELIKISNYRIIIMPGCGINEFNLRKILSETNAIEFHGSAKVNLSESSGTTVNGSFEHYPYITTDLQAVTRMVNIAKDYYKKNEK